MREASRRTTYFAFQGLLMAVLVLLFLYQSASDAAWSGRLVALVLATVASLAAVRLAPDELLVDPWFQTGLFLADAGLASLTLLWSAPGSDFYLLYFLIIFGTALTRDLAKSLFAALVTSLLFLATAWTARHGVPKDTGFWLRFLMLWTSAPLLAILSRDREQARADQERKLHERLVQLGRLATLGEVAGEVAHRIKGPLTTIMVNSDVLSHRHAKDAQTARELSEIREEAARCREILNSLFDLGRIEEMDLAPLDLREPVRLALKALEPQARAAGVSVAHEGLEAAMPVRGDHGLLQEAVSAVLQNAVDAVRAGKGSVRVGARPGPRASLWTGGAPAASWQIVVEDDGCGIGQDDLERVFTPFFTTKGAEGTGLGLSAALRIMQKHGGTIDAHSSGPKRGARFTLTLPAETA